MHRRPTLGASGCRRRRWSGETASRRSAPRGPRRRFTRGNEIAAELATTPDVEPHLDPPALDRHPPSGRSASFALMVSAGDQARASPLLDAERGPAEVLLELLQELRARERLWFADELGSVAALALRHAVRRRAG